MAVAGILKQQKRAHKSIDVDPYVLAGSKQSANDELHPGDRSDNRWHQYDTQTIPDTEEKWNNCTFVEKTHWGYYNWPK